MFRSWVAGSATSPVSRAKYLGRLAVFTDADSAAMSRVRGSSEFVIYGLLLVLELR